MRFETPARGQGSVRTTVVSIPEEQRAKSKGGSQRQKQDVLMYTQYRPGGCVCVYVCTCGCCPCVNKCVRACLCVEVRVSVHIPVCGGGHVCGSCRWHSRRLQVRSHVADRVGQGLRALIFPALQSTASYTFYLGLRDALLMPSLPRLHVANRMG